MNEINQFIKFEPILKEKIWGGVKLKNVLAKKTLVDNVGESWEISDVGEDVSIVVNGNLKGQTLKELLKTYTTDLVGSKVYKKFGNEFPLLIKFIDAKKPLSIQVHPDGELAKEKHNSFGKTEMWYVMESDKEAELIVGFKKDTNEEEYLHHLKNKTLLDILNVDPVKNGDVYFIPAGRVHAIGAGVLLAEIQETSDITYRIYDWNRKDANGNYRELHTEFALKAIDYSSKESYKTDYAVKNNISVPVVACPYFMTNVLKVTEEVIVNHEAKDSFVIYMCVKGQVAFEYKGVTELLSKGETLLVPASIKEFKIIPTETSELLEVSIN